MNADFFELYNKRLEERDLGDSIKQTGKDVVDRVKQIGTDTKEKGGGEAAKSAAKDAANYVLNGGPAGRVAHYATEDAEGGVGKMVHNFTGTKRETAADFGKAVAGRAAIALGVVMAPSLLKVIPGLTQGFLGKIIQGVLDFLGLGDKDADLDSIKQQLHQSQIVLDQNLQLDVNNLMQKSRTANTKYGNSIFNAVNSIMGAKITEMNADLFDAYTTQLNEGVLGAVGKMALGGIGKAAGGMMNMLSGGKGNQQAGGAPQGLENQSYFSQQTIDQTLTQDVDCILQKAQNNKSQYAQRVKQALENLNDDAGEESQEAQQQKQQKTQNQKAQSKR